MPEISVIVPVYKVEPYLRRCVDSILGQTFTDFEVILVDDGSPDGCPAICDEYAGKDERVRVIHQDNRGVSAARNAGLDWAFANSDSRWISFVDSDDWVHPRFLEYLHRAAVESELNVSICNYLTTEADFENKILMEYAAQSKNISDLYNNQEFHRILGFCWNKLYKKSLIQDTRFPEILAYSEDAVFENSILSELKSVVLLNQKLYYYYMNQNSVTHQTHTEKEILGILTLQQQCKEFEEQHRFEIAKACRIKVLNKFACYIDRCGNEPEQADNQKFLRRELRKELRKSKRQYHLKFCDYRWIYEKAYPKRMTLYWNCKRFCELVHREGFGPTFRRIKRLLLKR